jgi:valyl-tRNA synthetase
MAGPEAADRWILSRAERVTEAATRALEENRFSDAAWALYDFTWKEYCDWYLEFAKARFYGEDAGAKARAQHTGLIVLRRALALLHPFFPFLTERIWEYLPGSEGLLMASSWPEADGTADPAAEAEIERVQAVITAVRNMRAEMNVNPGLQVPVVIRADAETRSALEAGEPYLRVLAKVDRVTVAGDAAKPPRSASAVVGGMEVYLPLEGLIDLEAERQRLEKKRADLAKGLEAVARKLGNEQFVSRAPAEVVQSEAERRERLTGDLEVVERNLASLTEEG